MALFPTAPLRTLTRASNTLWSWRSSLVAPTFSRIPIRLLIQVDTTPRLVSYFACVKLRREYVDMLIFLVCCYLAKTMTLTLRRHDVKMGRGRGNDEWVGNIAFRRIVREHKAVYQQAPKDGKVAIAEGVVNAVIEDGGRFLQKATGIRGYATVSWATAVEKASQALREKAWVATVATAATATKSKKPPYKKKKKTKQRLEVVASAAVAAVEPTLVPGPTTVRFVDHAATSTTAPWSEEASPPPPPPQDALPELSLLAARTVSTSSSSSGSHNGANSMPNDDQNGLALVVAASSVELETTVPNSVLVVTTTTTTTPPPMLGLAAFSPPCTATAAAPWCCALEEDYTPNHFNQDCLVQGYAAPRPSGRNTAASDDDDDPISVSNDEEENNSVGMFDFDPMQAWHSLLHFGPSASPTSTLFLD
jgi:hypothetical protein